MYQNYNYNYPTRGNYRVVKNQYGNDRFIFPFLVGGVAGTALGYGIANNNQQKSCCMPMPYQPYQPVYYPRPPYPYYY